MKDQGYDGRPPRCLGVRLTSLPSTTRATESPGAPVGFITLKVLLPLGNFDVYAGVFCHLLKYPALFQQPSCPLHFHPPNERKTLKNTRIAHLAPPTLELPLAHYLLKLFRRNANNLSAQRTLLFRRIWPFYVFYASSSFVCSFMPVRPRAGGAFPDSHPDDHPDQFAHVHSHL